MKKIIDKLSEFFKAENEPVYDVSVFSDGKIETARFNKGNYCQNSYSVAKIFTVTAIGFLVEEGKITTETKLCDILKEDFAKAKENPDFDKRWNDITLHSTLKHRIGLPGGFLDIDCIDANTFGDDYLKFLLNTKLECEPGTRFSYTDAAYYLLSRTVSEVCGENMTVFLWKKLFNKLGYREVSWSQCPKGYAMGATGLYIGTPDMVKLGALYASEGVWKGEQIIPKKWVDTVIEREYELGNVGNGWYVKGGMYGQLLAVNPQRHISVALHGYDTDLDKIIGFITKSI